MLGPKKGKQLHTYVESYAVFDLETTGISCQNDRILEIAAVKVEGGSVTGEFSTLVNPHCQIPYGASKVNGITDEMVQGAPELREALSDFLDFIGDAVLVGHNIHSFDLNFIYRDCEALFGQVPGNDYLDTLSFAKTCLPHRRGYKLTDLASFYGIETDGAHRALQDCRMNRQVYELLRKEPEAKGAAPKLCPRCGSALVKRNGRYGAFFGCTGYPGCRYTENL